MRKDKITFRVPVVEANLEERLKDVKYPQTEIAARTVLINTKHMKLLESIYLANKNEPVY